MNLIQRVSRSLSETPLYRPAISIYNIFNKIVYDSPITDILNYHYITQHGSLVTVKCNNSNFQPFLIRLEPTGKLQIQRARGIYEPHVLSYLDENLNSESVFWEIGAAWGYFSLAAATRVSKVYSFEMMTERTEYIEESINANNFNNISVTNNKIDSQTDFTTYPHPDTVLVDIEGWEYVVLSNALEQLTDVSTWIVEVHSDLEGTNTDKPIKKIRTLFESASYTTTELNGWSEKNIHLVAKKV